MDKMLHRGKYAIDEHQTVSAVPVRGLQALIGITNEFNRRDKVLYFSTIGWTTLLITVFVIGTIYNFTVEVKTNSWITFWKYYVQFLLALSIVTTIWFAFGGLRDMKRMFKLLRTAKRNDLDDGMVVDHHNLDEEQLRLSNDNETTAKTQLSP